jgi:hypothetical protein
VICRLLADLVVLAHCGFVLFVVFGGLLALRWPRAPWIQLPAAIWGAIIEWSGGICPLTPLENRFRRLGGGAGYGGGFVEHYLLPVLYPTGLTRSAQLFLGMAVVVANLVVYAIVLRRARTKTR